MPELNVPAPAGATWEWGEVKTNHGQDSLGERPILVWDATPDGVAGAREFLGDEGVANALNGTSLLVSYQSIARRFSITGREKGQSDDEINAAIADAILKFRPGRRTTDTSPSANAARAAKRLSEATGEKGAEAIASLLERIRQKVAAGEMSADDVAGLQI